jgi:hypothetical protein
MLEFIKEVREWIIVVAPLVISLIIFIIGFFKKNKQKGLFENFINIEKVVKDLIVSVEGYINYTGADKKEWVKTKVNQFCIENKIPFYDVEVDKMIEQSIDLSKTVNAREKDKVKFI